MDALVQCLCRNQSRCIFAICRQTVSMNSLALRLEPIT